MGSLAQLVRREKAMDPAVRQQIYDSGEGAFLQAVEAMTDGIGGIDLVDGMCLDVHNPSRDLTDEVTWNLTRDAVVAANREANR